MEKLLLSILLILLPFRAFADMTVVQKMVSGPIAGQQPKNITITQYYKGTKSRVESSPNTYAIIDLKEGKMYTVDVAKKAVTVMSNEMIHKTMEMGMMMMGGGNLAVNKTGKTETVNGFKCDEYSITGSNLVVTAWVTQDVDSKELAGFRAFAQDLVGKTLADLPGIPIKSNSKFTMMGQEMTGSMEVLSISKDAIADSTFVIPADYQVQEMKLPSLQPH